MKDNNKKADLVRYWKIPIQIWISSFISPRKTLTTISTSLIMCSMEYESPTIHLNRDYPRFI